MKVANMLMGFGESVAVGGGVDERTAEAVERVLRAAGLPGEGDLGSGLRAAPAEFSDLLRSTVAKKRKDVEDEEELDDEEEEEEDELEEDEDDDEEDFDEDDEEFEEEFDDDELDEDDDDIFYDDDDDE